MWPWSEVAIYPRLQLPRRLDGTLLTHSFGYGERAGQARAFARCSGST
jgi:hypothetical protein